MYQYISSLVKNFKVSGNDSDGRKAVKKGKQPENQTLDFLAVFKL